MQFKRRWFALGGAAAAMPVSSARADIPRLAKIRKRAEPRTHALFAEAGITYPPKQMLLRCFKHDDEFEMWASSDAAGPLTLVKSYPVCAKSGELGPKRVYGDLQVPEGFYEIHRFNAWSAYHLSLRVDYPNASDKARGRGWGLGGAIMVHGDCVTIGCIPLQNDPIEEVFISVLDTQRKTRRHVPINIYPARLDDKGLEFLAGQAGDDEALLAFWNELVPAYQHFETNKLIPRIQIAKKSGKYSVLEPEPESEPEPAV